MPGFEELWFNRRDALQEEADNTVSKALRKAGWQHTSQTPGSIWMWQKEIDGKVYSVSTERAESIQEMFDRADYFRKYPDELND